MAVSQDEWDLLYTNEFDKLGDNNSDDENDEEYFATSTSTSREKKNELLSNINTCLCGNVLIKNSPSTMICNNCGTTRDMDDDIRNDGGGYKEMPTHRKIRIIGENSAKYRSDVFRSANTSENEFKLKCDLIFEELKTIYEKYLDYITDKNIPNKLQITKNILKNVAINYILCTIPSPNNQYSYETYKLGLTEEKDIKKYKEYILKIQNCICQTATKRTILRSANKKETLAALLYYICLSEGFACQKVALSKMFQLGKDGFASGEKYIRFFVSQGKIDIDLNISRVNPEINTLFNYIKDLFVITEETEEDYNNLKKAIISIHLILEEKFIAERSCVKSRIIGTSYIVIKRCKNKKLIPNTPTISKFCTNDIIRKTTVEKFITEMNDFHSNFVEVYKKYNLEYERTF